jgi:hypothetical protein
MMVAGGKLARNHPLRTRDAMRAGWPRSCEGKMGIPVYKRDSRSMRRYPLR